MPKLRELLKVVGYDPLPNKCESCGRHMNHTEKNYCYGCGHHVCILCAEHAPVGKHQLRSHRKNVD